MYTIPSLQLSNHRANLKRDIPPGSPTDPPAPQHCDVESERATADRVGFSPVSARLHCRGLPVKCGYCVENIPASAVLCSRRRLRPLSTLNPGHSLAAMLACYLNDGYLFSVSVVARANAGIGERAGGSRLLDLQRGSARRRRMFSTDQ
jgi:hypothetical protein